MDPASLSIGAISLIDVCVRFAKFLRDAQNNFSKTEETLKELTQQIQSLQSSAALAKSCITTEMPDSSLEPDSTYEEILQGLQTAFNTTTGIVESLEALCNQVICPQNERSDSAHPDVSSTVPSKDIQGSNKRRIGAFMRYLRVSNAEKEFNQLQTRLSTSQNTVQQYLQLLLVHRQNFSVDQNQHIMQSIEKLQEASASAHKISTLSQAPGIVSGSRTNEHFYLPKGVCTAFLGRSLELANLTKWTEVDPATTAKGEQRFVVFGLPGSGKTEFCCKFATEHRSSFWGVFYIDASSKQQAAQDFAKIATYGKVDANERAAKNWLCTQDIGKRWLLLVDNADDTSFPIEDCFPNADNGVVLITTRNPRLKTWGNIGSGCFQFEQLDEASAVELLLQTAALKEPVSSSTRQAAAKISQTLGCLPLGLVHAGKTLVERSMPIEDYLAYFEASWDRVKDDGERDTDATTIYSTYELLHHGLDEKKTRASEDALVLLSILAFFHSQRIRTDIFRRAFETPHLEAEERDHDTGDLTKLLERYPCPIPGFRYQLRSLLISCLSTLAARWNPVVLPAFLQSPTAGGAFDKIRFDDALRELRRWSLISDASYDGVQAFSIHPAVHLWLRRRNREHTGDQALWCHIAATVLAQALPLPPLCDTEDNQNFQRDILSHVSQVMLNADTIQLRLQHNQLDRSSWRCFSVLGEDLDRDKATRLIKFSLVYELSDRLHDAVRMREQVLAWIRARLGNEHEVTINLMLLLSRAYWKLTFSTRAAELLKEAVAVSTRVLGEYHPRTISAMDAYGSTLWLQGEPIAALRWLQLAYDRVREVRGEEHVETYRAMGNLGRAIGRDWRWDEAIDLHKRAVSGLDCTLGQSHDDTLTAKDNLAMAFFDRAAYGFGTPQDLDRAIALERYVFEQRCDRFGREHFATLWSGLNLARILGIRGQIDEALDTFRAGHDIAIRNFGENHFAILWGRTHLGRILTYARRYNEAEVVLKGVVDAIQVIREGPIAERKAHPDRLMAIFSLIKCRTLMGKMDAETCAYRVELKEGVKATFGEDHPAYRYLLNPKNQLIEPDDVDAVAESPQTELQVMLAKYGHIVPHDGQETRTDETMPVKPATS